MRKRAVYLLGAGASIPWGGPKTKDLTDIIRKHGFKNDKGDYITDEIYNWLTTQMKVSEKDVNFETILNVIEDFIGFWNSLEGSSTNGIIPFISKKDSRWSLFYSFELQNETDGLVDLIPINNSEFILERLRQVPLNEKEAKYFEILYFELLTLISGKIINYSYLTQTSNKIHPNENNPELLFNSVKHFNEKSVDFLLRVYTLNYDRVIQNIFINGEIPAYQGFKSEELIPSPYHSKLDPIGIHLRFDENCIYHLHGSFFWDVENLNGDVNYFLTSGPVVPDVSHANLNKNIATVTEIEKNRRIVISSIITGYQKTLRTSLCNTPQLSYQ